MRRSRSDLDDTPSRRLQARWAELVERIAGWWGGDDVRSADAAAVAADETGTLLALPFPFVTPSGGTTGEYGDLFGWDTYFINLGMLEVGLVDQVRAHIVDQLSLIERYGKVLNGNRTYYTTRGQPPLLAESVIRYAQRREDPELLELAYPLLVREYEEWWCGEGHATPTGLATNWDAGDPNWAPTLAAEAETGLDFTPIYDGDVRRCVPLLTNSALIAYANALAWIAARVGADGAAWQREAADRAERLRRHCWSAERACFVEYDFARERQLPYLSACTLWPLWAGAATAEQASGVVRALARLEHEHGLATTDRIYESPHPQYPGWLQWEFPAGWAPLQIVAVEALDRCGYRVEAERIAGKFLRLMLSCHESTGQLWEKYDVVSGGIDLPAAEHAANQEMRGWTAAAVVVLGKRVFRGRAPWPAGVRS